MSNAKQLDRLRVELKLRNYSIKTQRNYVGYVRQFARRFDRPLESLGADDVRTYQLELLDRGLSASTLHVVTCALRFLYKVVLKRTWMLDALVFPKRDKKIPVVLTQAQVRRIVEASPQPKYETLFITMYAMALRLGEVVNIKLTDIDAERMIIMIRNGKGRQDRIVPLSVEHLRRLRAHWRTTRSMEWLFGGSSQSKPISERAVQRAFTQARLAAGIHQPVGTHALRHSCATHLLEEGVDIRIIQKLLGHRNIQTTLIYTQVTTKALHVSVADMRHIKDLM